MEGEGRAGREECISLERNFWAHRPLLYNNRASSTLALYT